jgi:hypothetical protein
MFMNEWHEELNELKQFVADLKADRAAAKEKEKRESWTKYVSLTLVIVAVFAAIATQWAGKYAGRVLVQLNSATYNQTQASDQWAFYQAKSIKQNLVEIARGQLPKTPASAEAGQRAEELDKEVERYKKEKKEIMEAAQQFEKKREAARQVADLASEKGSGMGLAVSLFSVAIALASICLVTRKKPLWFLAMLLAAVAVGEMVRVWTL